MKFNDTFNEDCIMTGAHRKREYKDYARKMAGMFLRPTNEGQFYRFRLLNFPPDDEWVQKAGLNTYRDYPFILRYVHTAWIRTPDDKAPNGVRISTKQIACPASDYIMENSNLKKSMCPICAAQAQAANAYMDSGKTNQVAKKKMNECRNEFEALIPVYVISDPTYDANSGSVKVLSLDRDQYERLLAMIREATRAKTPIWNNDAVDLYMTYGKVEKVIPARGDKPEYKFMVNDIIKMGFTPNPHPISNLEALIPEVGFDENWYTIPTLEELQDFYVKYFSSQANLPDDIPNDIPVDIAKPASKPAPAPAPAPVAKKVVESAPQPVVANVAPPVKKASAPVVPDDIPDVPTKAATSAAQAPQPTMTQNGSNVDKDIDDFLAGLNV